MRRRDCLRAVLLAPLMYGTPAVQAAVPPSNDSQAVLRLLTELWNLHTKGTSVIQQPVGIRAGTKMYGAIYDALLPYAVMRYTFDVVAKKAQPRLAFKGTTLSLDSALTSWSIVFDRKQQ